MVIPLNASSVYVSWTAPTVSSISHYTVYYKRTIDDVLTLNLLNSSTSVVITDLTATSTQYEFRISVTIGEFEGPTSTFVRPGIHCNVKNYFHLLMSCLDHFHYCIIKSMHQSLYKTHKL